MRRALAYRTQLLYASDSLGGEALTESRGLWLLYYYAPPAHAKISPLLSLGLAGAVLTAVPLLCSIADPVIGYWSDRTSSRHGRRLPFIVVATPFWVLFSVLLFAPPREASTEVIVAFLAVMLALYSFASITSGGPYESLLPEIAKTSEDRMSVNGLKVYFGAAGGAIGLVASGLIVDRFGFLAMAVTIGVLALAFRFVGTAGVWRHVDRTTRPARVPLRKALRDTFHNRYFLLYLPGFVLFQVGLSMTRASLPYYVKAVLGDQHTGTWVAILTAVLIVAFVSCVPLQARAARRTSKRRAFGRAMIGAAIVFSLLSLVGLVPGVPAAAQIVVVMALAGLPVAGVYLFPAILTADIIDYDSTQTGMRREATYYQLHSFVEQAATSLAPGLLAALLLLGDSKGDQLGIRLVGPASGLLIFAGYLVFRHYDLADDVLADAQPETAV